MSNINTLLDRLAPFQPVDFASFGPVERAPLSRYQKLTGAFLGRNWVAIPHVTHHDEIDITDAEARRARWNADHTEAKLTPLALVMKAVVEALKLFPQFNASLTPDGENIVLKRYFHLGVAVDTPNGLLVPVFRDCDIKPASALARELAAIAQKARTKGLSIDEMSGSSMTITSLGHIGGTAFTPIINAPDVAILGITRAREVATRGPTDRVVWRTMLLLSLSYDHRVINGADAARFTQQIQKSLLGIAPS